MEHTRRIVTLTVLIGAIVPPAIAYLGYLAAGTPHVDCGETTRTHAFYRVAVPFFGLAGLVGAAALFQVARTQAEAKRHWIAESVAVLAAAVALDGFLPGALHHPAGGVVVVLGLAALVGAIVSVPVTIVLAAVTGTKLVRRRHAGGPDRSERRWYLFLVGWVLVAALPTLSSASR